MTGNYTVIFQRVDASRVSGEQKNAVKLIAPMSHLSTTSPSKWGYMGLCPFGPVSPVG